MSRSGVTEYGNDGGAVHWIDHQYFSVFVPIAEFDEVLIPVGKIESLGDGVPFFAKIILSRKLRLTPGKVSPSAKTGSNTGNLFVVMIEKGIARITPKVLFISDIADLMIELLAV